MCRWRTPQCSALCLNTAGRGGIFKQGETTNTIQRARIRRAKLFFEDRAAFLALLIKEIDKAIAFAVSEGLEPVFRLNGTSDLVWESIPVTRGGVSFEHIFAAYPTVQFYDYTKAPWSARRHDIANYVLTFSWAETIKNHIDAAVWIEKGANVSAVFAKELPAEFQGREVVNGDEHDLRFLDPAGVVVGLTAKGKAKKTELRGFVNEPTNVLDTFAECA